MTPDEMKEYIDSIVNGKHSGFSEEDLLWELGERDLHAPSMSIVDISDEWSSECDYRYFTWEEVLEEWCRIEDPDCPVLEDMPF